MESSGQVKRRPSIKALIPAKSSGVDSQLSSSIVLDLPSPEDCSTLNLIASLLPVCVKQYMCTKLEEMRPLDNGGVQRTVTPLGCVSVINILPNASRSNFSSILSPTEDLSPKDVDAYVTELNIALGKIIKATECMGGDLLEFVDNTAVIWHTVRYGEEGLIVPSSEGDDTIIRNMLFSSFEVMKRFKGDKTWNVRVGLGVGSLKIFHLGGFKKSYDLLLSGSSLVAAKECLSFAAPGQIMMEKIMGEIIADSALRDVIQLKHVSFTSSDGLSKHLCMPELLISKALGDHPLSTTFKVVKNIPNERKYYVVVTEALCGFIPNALAKSLSTRSSDAIPGVFEGRTITAVYFRIETKKDSSAIRIFDELEVLRNSDPKVIQSFMHIKSSQRLSLPGSIPVNESVVINTDSHQQGGADDTFQQAPVPIHHSTSSGRVSYQIGSSCINLPLSNMSNYLQEAKLNPMNGIQPLFVYIQKAVFEHKGIIQHFAIENKGCSVLACFGMSGSADIELSKSGVLAAFKAKQRLQAMDLNLSVGISTGVVYSGVVGVPERRDYKVYGKCITLCKLLSVVCQNDVLADKATQEECSGVFEFETLPPLNLPQFTTPIPAFRPTKKVGDVRHKSAIGDTAVFGNTKTRQHYESAIRNLKNNGVGGCYFIKGERGLGKSVVLTALREYSEQLFKQSMPLAVANIENHHTAYYVFRGILRTILGVTYAAESSVMLVDVIAKIRSLFPKENEKDEFQPLETLPRINSITDITFNHAVCLLPLLFKDILDCELLMDRDALNYHVATSSVGFSKHLSSLTYFMEFLIVSLGPMCIFIDDSHYVDSISLELLLTLRSHSSILIFLTTNPSVSISEKLSFMLSMNYSYNRFIPDDLLAYEPNAKVAPFSITLNALDRTVIQGLLGYHFDILTWPDHLLDFVMELAKGYPLISIEMIKTMKSKGYIRIQSGICTLRSSDGSELDTLNKSLDSLDRLIIVRFDDLSSDMQVILKHASVIGDNFSTELLQSIVPINLSKDKVKLHQILDDLCHRGFLLSVVDTRGGSMVVISKNQSVYKFENNFTRHTIYELIAPAKRKVSHFKLAQKIEQIHNDDLENVFPMLAYHYSEAGEKEKALKMLEMAAKGAMFNHSHEKCVHFLKSAVALGSHNARMTEFENVLDPKLKLAQWERQISLSLSMLGEFAESDKYKSSAFERVNRDAEALESIPNLIQSNKHTARRTGVALAHNKVGEFRASLTAHGQRQATLKKIKEDKEISNSSKGKGGVTVKKGFCSIL